MLLYWQALWKREYAEDVEFVETLNPQIHIDPKNVKKIKTASGLGDIYLFYFIF